MPCRARLRPPSRQRIRKAFGEERHCRDREEWRVTCGGERDERDGYEEREIAERYAAPREQRRRDHDAKGPDEEHTRECARVGYTLLLDKARWREEVAAR